MIICPYCGKIILAGAVTIKGEKYKCIYCKVWFGIKFDKLEKVKYIKL